MPSIIDSLVVLLNLDPSGFKRGQKEAGEAFNKTKEAAARTGKGIEKSGADAAGVLSRLKGEVVGLFAAFTAGRGLKAFLADVTHVDAETGRLAKTLSMTTESLSAWQGAANQAGGSAAGVTASIQGLQNQFQTFYLTGESAVLPYFRALGVATVDSSGKLRSMTDIMLDLADKFHGMDPARAAAFGRALGFDQGTINLLLQGREAVAALLKEQERLGLVSKEDAAAGAALEKAWAALLQASTSLGRVIATWLTPAMVKLSTALTDLAVWARKHGDFIKAVFIGLSAAATALAVAIALPVAKIALLSAAIGAAVTAIALLWTDWRTWVEGGKAQFGDFYQYLAEKWAAIRDVVGPIFEAWKTLMMGVLAFFRDSFKLIVTTFTGSGDEIREAWKKVFDDAYRYVLNFVDLIKKLAPVIVSAFKTAFSAAFEWLKGRFNAIWEAAFGRKLFEDVAPTAAPGAGLGVGSIGGAGLPVQAASGGGRDDRSWWQRHAPRWAGGRDAPGEDGLRRRGHRAERRGKAGPDGIAYDAKSLKEGVGINDAQYSAFREGLTDIEGKSYTQTGGAGGRYSGRYQFGPNEIKETARRLGEEPPSRAQFLADKEMQERYMENYTLDHHNYLMRNSPAYRAMSAEKRLEILGYAHNQGAGRGSGRVIGALGYLESGQAGKDGFGTSGTAYFGPIRRRLAQARDAGRQARPDSKATTPDYWDLLNRRAPDHVMQLPGQAQAAAASMSNSTSTSSTSNDFRVSEINVHTKATDADGIARDIGPAMRRTFTTAQANYGPA